MSPGVLWITGMNETDTGTYKARCAHPKTTILILVEVAVISFVVLEEEKKQYVDQLLGWGDRGVRSGTESGAGR